MNKIVPLDIEMNEIITRKDKLKKNFEKKIYKCDCCFDDTKDIDDECKKCILVTSLIFIFIFSISLGLTIYGMNNWNLDFSTGFQLCIAFTIPLIIFLIAFIINL